VGEGRTVEVVTVSAGLAVAPATRRYLRVGEGKWRIETPAGEAGPITVRVDDRGVPGLTGDVREWGLELD
jgi:hypothetical protein